jgi:hypothetical protein
MRTIIDQQRRPASLADAATIGRRNLWSAEILTETLANWRSLGALDWTPDGIIHLDESWHIPPVVRARAVVERGRTPDGDIGQPLVLLSLFDGVGTARLGLDAASAQVQYGGLVASWTVEIEAHLRTAVERGWSGHSVPCRPAAEDVWDLVRQPELMVAILRTVPEGAALLVVAGSPCQQLTTFSRHGGHQGLGGPDSSLFFAVPTVCWLVEQLRPDVAVHCVVENAGTMLPFHREAMCRTLRIPDNEQHGPRIDARQWSPFPRDRTWFGTIPQEAIRMPPRRPPPWENGWQPHSAGRMATMMRSRSRRLPVPSAYQLAPAHLIYRADGPLARSSLQQVGVQIRQHLPSRLHRDWDAILQRRDALHAGFATDLGDWLVQYGPDLGVRPPTVHERSRALGLEGYYDRLLLAPVATYDAQGNSFDHTALALRLVGLMQLLGARQRVSSHGFPPPMRTAQIFEDVRRYCLAHDVATEGSPYPAELRAAFRHTTSESILATLGFDAAPRGRREQ